MWAIPWRCRSRGTAGRQKFSTVFIIWVKLPVEAPVELPMRKIFEKLLSRCFSQYDVWCGSGFISSSQRHLELFATWEMRLSTELSHAKVVDRNGVPLTFAWSSAPHRNRILFYSSFLSTPALSCPPFKSIFFGLSMSKALATCTTC